MEGVKAENYFIYHGRLASLNEYITACRQHPQKGAKLKRDAEGEISWEIIRAKAKGHLQGVNKPCRVHFYYQEQTAKRDLDNISGFAHKVLLDALVSMGILPNDTQKWVVGFTDNFFIGDKDLIKVVIEEVED